MTAAKWRSKDKHELIIEVWEALDCESVGARELEQIQTAVNERFGAGAVESPAAIARILADEGANLRHPEVLACDTRWREQELSTLRAGDLNFSGLLEAAESIKRLDELRRQFEEADEQLKVQRLREMALQSKQEVALVSRSPVVEKRKRLEAGEIVQWLTVWLQEPGLFEDWLSLRQRSPEFKKLVDG